MRLFSIFLVISATLLVGCSSPAGAGSHAGEPYSVKAQRTLFYTYGPAQVTGPDFALSRGQRVTMLSYAYGYSHVAIPGTGQSGYVPTEDLVPAPPAAQPSPSASPHHRHIANSRAPTADEQAHVPLPEFPESMPPPWTPPFRY